MIYGFDGRESPPNNPLLHQPFSAHSSGLADVEIQRIRDVGDALESTSVKLYGQWDRDRVDARGSHFPLTDETRWVYERMADVARRVNADRFQYDLTGFHENFYYLRYGPGEHFGWHVDIGAQTPAPRKLSLILQLSDPAEFDGGDFEVLVADKPIGSKPEKGLVFSFPSYRIHRVTPVTRGLRRALVAFAAGPNFR